VDPRFVTFLSDFGLQDDFVGVCHGVIKRIAPTVEIVDITHGIPPRAVLQGALVLANTIPYMPTGVHLAVVDPGVGGIRRPVVLRTRTGRLFVGPDNGLPVPAVGHSRLRATILYVDGFGNIQLNLAREHLEQVGIVPGTRVELRLGPERYYAIAARTFSDARPGDIILYEDAYRRIAVAISRGSAAAMFGAAPGQELRIDVDRV